MVSYKLSDIIKETLIENGDTNLNKYARFLQIAVAGLREFNLDVSGTPTTVEIPMAVNGTFPLPKDYIQYVKIAVVGSDLCIHELGLNSNMTFARVFDNCGNPQINNTQNPNTVPAGSWMMSWEGYTDKWRNGEMMGRFFGIGGGNNSNGYYRIDKANGYIQLENTNTTSIVLEYLADITLSEGDFVVHPYLIETLKAWIYWRSIQRNPSRPLGEKQLAEGDYWKAHRNSLRRFNANTPQEWLSAFRKANKAAPRF